MKELFDPKYFDLLTQNFNEKTIHRGQGCYEQSKVHSLEFLSGPAQFNTKVESSSTADLYRVHVDIDWESNIVEGTCSCPVGYNCKHVVASILEADDTHNFNFQLQKKTEHTLLVNNKSKGLETSSTLEHWFDEFNREINEVESETNNTQIKNPTEKTQSKEHLLYILNTPVYSPNHLYVDLKLSRVLKKGGYGKPKDFRLSSQAQQKHIKPEDIEAISALKLMNQISNIQYNREQGAPLSGQTSSKCLEKMIETGRCMWQSVEKPPLRLGAPKSATFHWEILEDAHQRFNLLADNQNLDPLVLDELWYIDKRKYECGRLNTPVPSRLLETLLKAPSIPPQAAERLKESLAEWVPNSSYLPQTFTKTQLLEVKQITPEIRFDYRTLGVPFDVYVEIGHYSRISPLWPTHPDKLIKLELPTAEIFFDYSGKRVPFSFSDTNKSITYLENGKVYAFKRDLKQEEKWLMSLQAYLPFSDAFTLPKDENTESDCLILKGLQREEDCLEFSLSTLPELEQKGWRIIRMENSFSELLYDEDLDWYSELDESSEYDYFSYRMGIVVDGETIDILPIIAKLMKSNTAKDFRKISDEEQVTLPLENGKLLSIPFSRIKPIANILLEIYDSEITESSLKVGKHQAALVAEIEKAFRAAQMRWMGGERLVNLGRQLSDFKSIQTVTIPKTFKATLRSYQQAGVNWLQFLRQYQLGGILADDMGLGKTVQTLAHFSIEKNKGRLKKPSLIIAPTSLMHNWKSESAKFTPHLKTLVFHGDERHLKTDQISQAHLVFTTYSLVLRDKKHLLEQDFYYLILDEAQFIKNHKAKSTQVVQQIKTEHRLCLTGTPMENHLLELWSLFHFLMPGFLGKLEQFKKIFKSPIEKHNDLHQQKSLSQRISPFLLRRKKSEVLKDLPKKTEVVRKVELKGAQRDLYESIRLSMEKKVRAAIQKQGTQRSHIIILDALLKLRQTCCDPKLLSLESAKKAQGHSAKLEMLMEMLPNMVEEGQKILIFSQFTKMLKLIEEKLKNANLNYVKLTGATKQRDKPILAFQNGDTPIFLISLKAGGTGLNLTAADTVIHYDPWWNPAVEDQATDRAHRMGQTKPVFVYKLLTSGTVEETIQEMQQKKRQLVEGLFTEEDASKLSLSSEALASLFKSIE